MDPNPSSRKRKKNEPVGMSVSLKPCSSSKATGTTSVSETCSESPAIGTSVLDIASDQKIHVESVEIDEEDTIIISKREYNQLKESIKLLSETMKSLQETLLTKSDLLEFAFKEEEPEKKIEDRIPKKMQERTRKIMVDDKTSTCCFESKEAYGNNNLTLLVKGFDNVRPRDEIKKDLSDIFRTCGEVTRVFVPIECKTRFPLRFAFVDLKNGEGNDKALELNKARIRGWKYRVKMAKDSNKFLGYPNFVGCDRCRRKPIFGRRR